MNVSELDGMHFDWIVEEVARRADTVDYSEDPQTYIKCAGEANRQHDTNAARTYNLQATLACLANEQAQRAEISLANYLIAAAQADDHPEPTKQRQMLAQAAALLHDVQKYRVTQEFSKTIDFALYRLCTVLSIPPVFDASVVDHLVQTVADELSGARAFPIDLRECILKRVRAHLLGCLARHRISQAENDSRGQDVDLKQVDAAFEEAVQALRERDALLTPGKTSDETLVAMGRKEGALARMQRFDLRAAAQHNDSASRYFSLVDTDHARGQAAFHEMMRDYLLLDAAITEAEPDALVDSLQPVARGVRDLSTWWHDDSPLRDNDTWKSLRLRFLIALALASEDPAEVETTTFLEAFLRGISADSPNPAAQQVVQLAHLALAYHLLASAAFPHISEAYRRQLGELQGLMRSILGTILREGVFRPEDVEAIDDSEDDHAVRSLVEQAVAKARAGGAAENDLIEFKTDFASSKEGVLKTVIAFANRCDPESGLLVLGIADDGEVTGMENDIARYGGSRDALNLAILQFLRDNLAPGLPPPEIAIRFLEVERSTVVVVAVPPGPYVRNLYTDAQNRCYVRRGGASVALSNVLERDDYAERRAKSLAGAAEAIESAPTNDEHRPDAPLRQGECGQPEPQGGVQQ